MTRRNFIESQGGSCSNWRWSWSFRIESKKIIIFGAWDEGVSGDLSLIVSKDWKYSDNGRKLPGYTEALLNIKLIQNEGYQLKTFPIYYSDELKDQYGKGPSKIKDFGKELSENTLVFIDGNWYAIDEKKDVRITEQIEETEEYIEGSKKKVFVNAYERDGRARAKCIERYGYKCAVCVFDFSEFYGSIGNEFIHVHHLKQLSTIKTKYKVDPIKDLRPVCPNCHAMIHRRKEALTIEELKNHIKVNLKESDK